MTVHVGRSVGGMAIGMKEMSSLVEQRYHSGGIMVTQRGQKCDQ